MRWVHRLVLLGAIAMCPAAAAAHGGDAAIVRVAAIDRDGSPWLLQLSEGLALRDDEGWRFVCPAAFEASAVLHALSASDGAAWAVTLRGVFRIAASGAIERSVGQCGDTPIRLVAHRGAVHLLARDSARAQHLVCALEADGPREIHVSEAVVDDLASDGERLWLVRLAGDGFGLEAVEDGARRVYSGAMPRRAVRLAFANGALYARLIDFGRTTLVLLLPDRTESLLEVATSVSGPVEAGGAVFAGSGGQLVALDGATASTIETELVVDEVDGIRGRGFAFAAGGLYALPLSAAGAAEPSFTLDGVRPPAGEVAEACSLQWQRFERARHAPDHALDASVVDLPDARAGERGERGRDAGAGDAPAARRGGCSVSATGMARMSGELTLMLAFGIFALARRTRR